jgi:hypothetical protein
MSLLPGRRVRWAALGAVACALVMGGIAYASIPGPDGVIHGCYLTNGNLRVIDSAASCKSNETSLNWNQQGVTGPSGPTGATGPTGPTGPSQAFVPTPTSFNAQLLDDVTPTTVESLSLPAGSYVLNAAVSVAGNNGGADESVRCLLVGNHVQTLGPEFLTKIGNLGAATVPVTSAFTLSATTDVSIECLASTAGGAVTQPSTMTAIRVASLTES